MVGLDSPDFPLSRFVGVDMQSVKVLAHVVQRFEFGVHTRAYVGLDTEVQEPGP